MLKGSVIILSIDSVSIVAVVHSLIDPIVSCNIWRIDWLIGRRLVCWHGPLLLILFNLVGIRWIAMLIIVINQLVWLITLKMRSILLFGFNFLQVEPG